MYTFLDYLFIILHSGFILFNLTGWAWQKTRRIHLATMSLTMLSWFGLGIFYGWGYCPSTDWHWQVKYKLGETRLPNSYIKYCLDKLTGHSWNPTAVDAATLIVALTAFALSCWFNWKDSKFP